MEGFQQGQAQGEKLGGIIFIFFRIAWFFFRIAWWLGQFLIFSLFAGMVALVKMGRPGPDITTGFGHFSEDGTRWQDRHTGQEYPVSKQIQERCEVEATMGGLHWRRNALSRLVKRGAIFRYTFAAVGDGGTGRNTEPFAQEEFLNEARHNITLDDLNPEFTASDPYNLGQSRDEAVSALERVDWLLTNRGWKRENAKDAPPLSHWYAWRYTRSIRWDQPIHMETPAVAVEPGEPPAAT